MVARKIGPSLAAWGPRSGIALMKPTAGFALASSPCTTMLPPFQTFEIVVRSTF